MSGITTGPKLGLLNNANIGQQYFDQFRQFLQALDQLVQMSVLNATAVVPPSTPNNGDAYLLIGGTPSGAWTGFAGYIAVWDTQVTESGTNIQAPAWVFYSPQPGWVVWNVALAGLYVYNGASWGPVGGIPIPVPVSYGGTGANTAAGARTNLGAAASGVNSDITNMTALYVTTGQTALTVEGNDDSAIAISWNDGISGHAGGITLGGEGYFGGIECSGEIVCGGLLSSAPIITSSILNGTPGVGISFGQSGGGAVNLNITGTGTLYSAMLGFSDYSTQTTVGSAGGASALPATPTGYLPVQINGTNFIIPYYAVS